MKLTLIALAALAPMFAQAATKVEWKSVYTDTAKDCVVVSASTDRAPIDFSASECKSFGGYRLLIDGGDLRYGPSLSYSGKSLEIGRPGGFHDPAGTQVEWIYRREVDEEGSGKLQWKGFIYRLSVTNEDGNSSRQELHVVRLDGAKTCHLGLAKTNEAARAMVKDASARCPQ